MFIWHSYFWRTARPACHFSYFQRNFDCLPTSKILKNSAGVVQFSFPGFLRTQSTCWPLEKTSVLVCEDRLWYTRLVPYPMPLIGSDLGSMTTNIIWLWWWWRDKYDRTVTLRHGCCLATGSTCHNIELNLKEKRCGGADCIHKTLIEASRWLCEYNNKPLDFTQGREFLY
jgi:hypothetical protein